MPSNGPTKKELKDWLVSLEYITPRQARTYQVPTTEEWAQAFIAYAMDLTKRSHDLNDELPGDMKPLAERARPGKRAKAHVVSSDKINASLIYMVAVKSCFEKADRIRKDAKEGGYPRDELLELARHRHGVMSEEVFALVDLDMDTLLIPYTVRDVADLTNIFKKLDDKYQQLLPR